MAKKRLWSRFGIASKKDPHADLNMQEEESNVENLFFSKPTRSLANFTGRILRPKDNYYTPPHCIRLATA